MLNQRQKRLLAAIKNRQELIGLSRRELFRMGLLTAGGYLVAKDGLSARAAYADPDTCVRPATRTCIELLPTPRDGTMPIQTPVVLSPAPTAAPNTASGEGRTITHQAFTTFPPQKFYGVTQKAGSVSVSPDLPLQTLWGFAVGTPTQNNSITSPGFHEKDLGSPSGGAPARVQHHAKDAADAEVRGAEAGFGLGHVAFGPV